MKLLIGRQGEEDEEREKEAVKEEEEEEREEEEVIGESDKIKKMIGEESHGLKKAFYIRPVFYSNSPDDTKLD